MAIGKKKQKGSNGWFRYAHDPPLNRIDFSASGFSMKVRVAALILFAFFAIGVILGAHHNYSGCPNEQLMVFNFFVWTVVSFAVLTPKFSAFRNKFKIESMASKILIFLIVYGIIGVVHIFLSIGCLPPSEEVIQDNCISIPASELDTYHVIPKEQYDCYLDTYMLLAVSGEVNYTICAEIIPEEAKLTCYGLYAGYQGSDNSICSSESTNTNTKDSCLAGFAASLLINHPELLTFDICDEIAHPDDKDRCREEVLGNALAIPAENTTT